jgi:hypothetical protein
MIEDQRVATSYAIEALRIFDHLHFRLNMEAALGKKTPASAKNTDAPDSLTLQKPKAISGKPAWFEESYQEGTQAEHDRQLFAR